jgi:hypothetical protein
LTSLHIPALTLSYSDGKIRLTSGFSNFGDRLNLAVSVQRLIFQKINEARVFAATIFPNDIQYYGY